MISDLVRSDSRTLINQREIQQLKERSIFWGSGSPAGIILKIQNQKKIVFTSNTVRKKLEKSIKIELDLNGVIGEFAPRNIATPTFSCQSHKPLIHSYSITSRKLVSENKSRGSFAVVN